jgi:membrane protein implicated in regulation of membrane protease activity
VDWWIWLVAGIALMLGELLTPGGFYLIFFGVGGVAAGLAAALGVSSLTAQVMVFLAVSMGALFFFRRPMLERLRKGQPAAHDELTGEVVVPQQSAFVVERLGAYSGTLNAGFHVLIPFLDVIRYKHSLKEQAHRYPRAGLYHAR